MKLLFGPPPAARYAWSRAFALLLVLITATVNVYAASVTYEHDARGRVKKATYNDGTIIEYAYDGNGNRTSTLVTALPPDTTPPLTPGAPSFANITMTSARASWSAATDNVGVVAYEYRVNSGNWISLGNVLSVELTGLSALTSYTVQVRGKDAANNVGPASSGTFSTIDTAPPSVPTGLTGAAASSTIVNLSWNASTDNVAVAGYKVFRNGTQIATRTTTSYSDNGLTGSTTYSYSVRAYDASNNDSAASGAINVTTPDTIAPGVPSGLSAAAVDNSRITLSWSGSADTGGSGLAGYRVYRNGAHITNVAVTSYTDAGLASSTAYSYTVAAYDNANNTSGQSNTASATTKAALQAMPSSTSWRFQIRPNGTTVVSPNVVVTASGGSGSGYTYGWQFVSGDTQTSINAAANSASWSRSVSRNEVFASVWRCLVTDSSGNSAYTPNITVTFRWDTND